MKKESTIVYSLSKKELMELICDHIGLSGKESGTVYFYFNEEKGSTVLEIKDGEIFLSYSQLVGLKRENTTMDMNKKGVAVTVKRREVMGDE